jgi:serine/threonine-protein kinase 19
MVTDATTDRSLRVRKRGAFTQLAISPKAVHVLDQALRRWLQFALSSLANACIVPGWATNALHAQQMSKLRLALPQPPLKRRRTREHVQHWAPTSSDVAAPSSPTNVDFIEEAAPEALPNDTLTALHLLKSRFPAEVLCRRLRQSVAASSAHHTACQSPWPQAAVTPFASRSQLYSVLADRTLADRQLEELRRTAAIRLLQLPASRDECAVVLAGDYAAAVQRCKAGLEEKQQQQSGAASSRTSGSTSMDLDVFDWFAERVLPLCSEVMITHSELVQLLGTAPGAAR